MPRKCKDGPGTPLRRLLDFAAAHHFRVTSTCGGKHNAGSAHPESRAIDVSVRGKSDAEVEAMMRAARAAGIHVRDERVWPAGQKEWSAPHVHLEFRR